MRAGEILDDRYVLDRVLGQGGMGVVWAAHDRRSGQRVAVKMLLEDGSVETNLAQEKFRQELRQRLRREAAACLKLADHPNVVRVLDVWKNDAAPHGPYVVMELLEGGSLQDHLKRKRLLEPKVAARIAANVASCLMAAHAAKLVHRDLKPANIYLHIEPGMHDDEFITKVLDFGVCKDGDTVEIASDNTPTMTGMVLGSIAYMSPQQAMGSKNVDFRTDIWSVGVVLYEMLTGLRAFSGSVNDIIAQYGPILIGKNATPPVPAPSSRTRNIPPALDAIVERCTKPKPADRYASAEELARDLYAAAGLPMPVIPTARPSSSAAASVELIDLYEPAIMGSNAVPSTDEERRFNAVAQTIPLIRGPSKSAHSPAFIEEKLPVTPAQSFGAPINVPDTSDTDATLRMPSKNAVSALPRPPSLRESSPDAGVRTQYLAPGGPVASPAPDMSEMQRVLEEHRKSSTKIPIPDLSDLDVAGGTQMLKTLDIPPSKRPEPSATTSVSMTQSLQASSKGGSPPDAASTTGRRRRNNNGLLAMIAAAGVAAAGLVIFVVVKQSGTSQKAPVVEPESKPAPPTPLVTTPPQEQAVPDPTAPPVQAPKVKQTPPAPSPVRTVKAQPQPTAPPTSTTFIMQPIATAPPAGPAPGPKAQTTTKTSSKTKVEPTCTGVGLFKKCK